VPADLPVVKKINRGAVGSALIVISRDIDLESLPDNISETSG